MLQLEGFGFCEQGAGGHYVSSGAICSAAGGRTTPAADTCARAIPTA
jgi:hypothetical protein